MAPRRGGGGDGTSSSSSSTSTCDSSYTYPCTTQLHYIYGDHVASHYTQSEVYGQLVLNIIWCLTLIALLASTLKTKARWLQATILLFLASFIFLSVRFGLIVSESDVPIGYRYESSVVVLLQRLGAVLLFAAAFSSLEARKVVKFMFYPGLGVLAVLNIAYLILDFLVSSKALVAFKESWIWRLSDRDFGLQNTPHSMHELTMNGLFTLSPFYVEDRMFDIAAEDGWQAQRGAQIKIGVAAAFLSVVLSVFLGLVAGMPKLARKKTGAMGASGRPTIYLLVAAFGLLVTSLFQVVAQTHYVLWNWNIVSDLGRWIDWTDTFEFDGNGLIDGGGGGFLKGYRVTVNGFPIIQAVFEPLGVVLASLAVALLWRARRKDGGV